MHKQKREKEAEVAAVAAAMRKRKDNLKKNQLHQKQENNNLQLIPNNNHNIPRILTSAVAKEETKTLKKNQMPQIVDSIFA